MKRQADDADVVIISGKRISLLSNLGHYIRNLGFLNCFLEAPLVRLETLKYESTFPN